MNDGGAIYNKSARQRINQTVLRVEGLPLVPLQELPASGQHAQTIWLVRATEFVLHDTVGAFQILVPDTADSTPLKGDEEDGPYNDLDCYVRKGLCFENGIYLALEVCGADDAVFEILNPTMAFTGTSQETIAQDATGTVRLDGADADTEVEVKAVFGDVEDAVSVRCAFDEATEEWHAIQQPCSA